MIFLFMHPPFLFKTCRRFLLYVLYMLFLAITMTSLCTVRYHEVAAVENTEYIRKVKARLYLSGF